VAENITTALPEAISFIGGPGMAVTARQRQIYDFLCRYVDTHEVPPTIAEIGKQFHMTSPASVHSILSGPRT